VQGLRHDLSAIVGDEGMPSESELATYCHDATIQRGLRGRADAVVRPADARQVARVLAYCYEQQIALVPRGGGTGLAGGATPVVGGVVCSLERLRSVLEIQPALWRMRVQAGLTTAAVHRLARENGLYFAPDPGASELSQIGGNAATNAGGPHAFKYGSTGDLVSELEVVLAPGEIAHFGSGAVKDACGYDLRGLLVGSEGTLGVITELTLRLLPAPPRRLAMVLFLEDRGAAQRLLLEILASGLRPAVLDFVDGKAFAAAAGTFPASPHAEIGMALLLELDGLDGQVQSERAEIESLAAQHQALEVVCPPARPLWRWRDGLSLAISAQRGGKISEDVAVPPERLDQAIGAIYALGESYDLPACTWGHAGDGIVHATFMIEPSCASQLERALAASEEVFDLAHELGGTITGEHGVGWTKRAAFQRHTAKAALRAQRQIKDALDPKGLLNPHKNCPLENS
jgi:glycolate oxidase subunit GlcD